MSSKVNKKKMRLPPELLKSLLKEGKMEKLPNGSYRIREDVLKELQQNASVARIIDEKPTVDSSQEKDSPSDSRTSESEEAKTSQLTSDKVDAEASSTVTPTVSSSSAEVKDDLVTTPSSKITRLSEETRISSAGRDEEIASESHSGDVLPESREPQVPDAGICADDSSFTENISVSASEKKEEKMDSSAVERSSGNTLTEAESVHPEAELLNADSVIENSLSDAPQPLTECELQPEHLASTVAPSVTETVKPDAVNDAEVSSLNEELSSSEQAVALPEVESQLCDNKEIEDVETSVHDAAGLSLAECSSDAEKQGLINESVVASESTSHNMLNDVKIHLKSVSSENASNSPGSESSVNGVHGKFEFHEGDENITDTVASVLSSLVEMANTDSSGAHNFLNGSMDMGTIKSDGIVTEDSSVPKDIGGAGHSRESAIAPATNEKKRKYEGESETPNKYAKLTDAPFIAEEDDIITRVKKELQELFPEMEVDQSETDPFEEAMETVDEVSETLSFGVAAVPADSVAFETKVGGSESADVKIINSGNIIEKDGQDMYVYYVVTNNGETSSKQPIYVPVSSEMKDSVKGGCASCLPKHEKLARLYESRTSAYRELKKVITSLYLKLVELRKMQRENVKLKNVAEIIKASSNFLTEDQVIFFSLQLRAACSYKDPEVPLKYTLNEKILALTLYQMEPAMYNKLRRIFHLPRRYILELWLDEIAHNNPDQAKALLYHVYTKFDFKPLEKEDITTQSDS